MLLKSIVFDDEPSTSSMIRCRCAMHSVKIYHAFRRQKFCILGRFRKTRKQRGKSNAAYLLRPLNKLHLALLRQCSNRNAHLLARRISFLHGQILREPLVQGTALWSWADRVELPARELLPVPTVLREECLSSHVSTRQRVKHISKRKRTSTTRNESSATALKNWRST